MKYPITRLVFLYGKPAPKNILSNPWFRQLEAEFEVEIWDIGDILFDGLPRFSYGVGDSARSIHVPSIEAFRHLLVSRCGSDTLVIYNDASVECRRNAEATVKEITENGFNYAVMDVANSFNPATDLWWLHSRLQVLKRRSVLGFRNRRMWFWRSVRPPLFALVASRMREDALRIQGLSTRFIRAHSRDYEYYLELKRCHASDSLAKSDKMGVFVDQGMAGNMHHVLDRCQPAFGIEEYYGRVGRFLEEAARQFGLDEIAVSLHPGNQVAEGEVKDALRSTVCSTSRGNTARLIDESDVVISHHTSAFALAVLLKRPVCFFCPGVPRSVADERLIKQYAKVLRRRVNYTTSAVLDAGMDEEAYCRFRHRYAKERDTKDASYFKILADEVRSLRGCQSHNRIA